MLQPMDIIHYLRELHSNNAELTGKASAIQEAELFTYILSELPITIFDQDLLAGDFGIDLLTEQDELYQNIATWKSDKEKNAKQSQDFPSPTLLMREHFHCFGSYTSAHTCVNYERVINEGLTGILTQVENKLKECSDPKQQPYLQAIAIALKEVINWAERFAGLAEKMALEASCKKEQQRLQHIANNCKQVPFKPAKSFYEAVQSIWVIHALIGVSERNSASISLGRLDQYLYPFFKQDLTEGKSPADLEAILTALFLKLNRYGDAACTVNVGGVDEHGDDLFNPLSEMITKLVKKLQLASPILAVRVHPDISEDVLDSMLVPELFINGQPTFYGEYACQEAMKKRGVPEDDCYKWTANSCMGLVMAGAEISDMWGSVINFLLPLELALNNGNPFQHSLPIDIKTKAKAEFDSFDEFYSTFCSYLKDIIDFCIQNNDQTTKEVGIHSPNPFLSALIDNCIEQGKDRADGGAKYHTIIIEAFGLVNAADALFAINELVFKTQKYSLHQLIEAVKNNFENTPEILNDILALPKFGNNSSDVDQLASKLASYFAEIVCNYNHNNRFYAPSFHTLNGHVPAGKKMGASLDGRLKGEPLAKNIGPMLGRGKDGHTSIIQSATAIDQSKFSGGQALDLSFNLKLLKNKTERTKLIALFQTYFRNGGLQIQVNGIDSEILKEAIEHPENHNDLIVRIGGYSCYFNKLGKDIQKEMINRFACGQ